MSPIQFHIRKNPTDQQVTENYEIARERYAMLGIDTEWAMQALAAIPISLHCWQGDDVGGFENPDATPGGGIAVTGNYPGKARTIKELRRDVEKVLSLIPGKHRLNLHAIYGDFEGQKVERDSIAPKHFESWAAWAKEHTAGVDFNPTCFGHPKAADGFTLSHQSQGVRDFWIEHCIACREIGAYFGEQLSTACITNVWVPDGMKDVPVDRLGPRKRLAESLDRIFAKEIDPKKNLDAVESKLFGIGAESYTVGSHEFYLGYAIQNHKLYCLDAGHFHPTESISDKVSAIMCQLDEMLLHVSRGVRWDSDHVVTLSDEVVAIAQEVVRGGFLGKIHFGLDFFDASINRLAAWIIGTRAMIKALLSAMLEPAELLGDAERSGDYTSRLALLEELKTLPMGAVWDRYLAGQGLAPGAAWLEEIAEYETSELSTRS